MPVAVNCCVAPALIDAVAGVTAIDCNVFVTVNTAAGEVTEPRLAVMLLEPAATPVASPAALIVATEVVPDVQVTELVMLALLPSLYVPVAVNCCVAPALIEAAAGVTAIDCNVFVTVNTAAGDVTEPSVAVMLLEPALTPVARPAALIVATEVVPDVQVTELVIFAVLPSL